MKDQLLRSTKLKLSYYGISVQTVIGKKILQLLSERNLYSESGIEAINGLLKSGIITFADNQSE